MSDAAGVAAALVAHLASVRLADVFNPYAEHCPHADRPDAASRRRQNLRLYLGRLFAGGVDVAWIGRDLGYRGGRRTGLPFTDEAHLAAAGDRLGLVFLRAAIGAPVRERTAGHVWRAMAAIDRRVLLWNVFPWHPHRPGEPLSNRAHRAGEAAIGGAVLAQVLAIARPAEIIAVGRAAEHSLAAAGIAARRVRHPSHGGEAAFARGIAGNAAAA